MDEKKIVLCRLCLDVIQFDDSEVLDTVSKNILLVLIPALNLDVTDEPRICQNCNKLALAYYEFKNKCNEKILHTEVKCEEGSGNEEDCKKCYFCQDIINIKKRTKAAKELAKTVLNQCFSNWKLFIEDLMSICKQCVDSMVKFSKFLAVSLENEQQIRKYCSSHGTDSRGKINLYEALQHILDRDIKADIPGLKTEEINIKIEEFDENAPPGKLSRRDLFTVLRQKIGESRKDQRDHLFNYLVWNFDVVENFNAQRVLRKECISFCSKIYLKLGNCAGNIDKFLNKYGSWLDETIDFKIEECPEETSSPNSSVRPRQLFPGLGERTKRKRSSELAERYEAEELAFAAIKGLKEKGQKSASDLILEAVFTTPTRSERIRSAWLKSTDAKPVPFSDDEALSLITEAKLSKRQYIMLRGEAKKRNVYIYPNYQRISEARRRRYPPKETDSVAKDTVDSDISND